MLEAAVDLTVPSLAELHERRSEKWAPYDADVLSLTVAEMDFPIADPIREMLLATIERGDLGYALPAAPATTHALARFAERRLHWRLDPDQVTVVPDVMVGLVELCRIIATPRRGGLRAQQSAQPDGPRLLTRGTREHRGAVCRCGDLGARRRDPRAARPPRQTTCRGSRCQTPPATTASP